MKTRLMLTCSIWTRNKVIVHVVVVVIHLLIVVIVNCRVCLTEEDHRVTVVVQVLMEEYIVFLILLEKVSRQDSHGKEMLLHNVI